MTTTREINVSQTFANMLPMPIAKDPAENSALHELEAEGPDIRDLGALFRSHYKGMFRVAYRITGSSSDAEDVLQTVFVRLTPGWEKRDLAPNARAFLYRAAINASLDIVRRRKRMFSVPLEVVDLDPNSKRSADSPEKNLVDTELKELLRQA